MLDKKVKKELKQTLKHTKDLLTVDSSTLTGMQKDDHDSLLESGLDSVASSSLQSSQNPKGSKMGGSQEKSGTKDPIIQKTIMPLIEGAIVTAKGANDAGTKTSIINAVQAATGLSIDRIQVFEMK